MFYLRGQGAPTGNSPPYFGPSLKLDFELEMVKPCAIILLFNTVELIIWFCSLFFIMLLEGCCSWSWKWIRKAGGCEWGSRSHFWTCVDEWLEWYACFMFLSVLILHVLQLAIFDKKLIFTARDIQAWEYIPLGPFLGKSFGKHWKLSCSILKFHR